MIVEPFIDQYAELARLSGRREAELRERDTDRLVDWHRMLALRGDETVASLTAVLRPDQRAFVSLLGFTDAFAPLIRTLRAQQGGLPLYANCSEFDSAHADTLRRLGFRVELTFDRFRVGFREAISALARVSDATGWSIESAASLEPDRLFALDNSLRQLVPGTDGWIGNKALFVSEITTDPAFDPAAYLVGREDRTGEYGGLIRIWRNPPGPKLGMIGVLPPHRRTLLGPTLLKAGLLAASRWGHEHFVTETATTNRHIHHRLTDIGATRVGREHVWVLR